MQLSVIQNKIYEIRGSKVMLDRDLAEMYEVQTFRLNEAVKRNITRFPKDFMFQITKDEMHFLISQNAISKKTGRGGTRKLPRVLTEQGVAMLSSVLNSERAIQVNIIIIRTFVLIRQAALANKELYDKIIKLEKNTIKISGKYSGHLSSWLQKKRMKKILKNVNGLVLKLINNELHQKTLLRRYTGR